MKYATATVMILALGATILLTRSEAAQEPRPAPVQTQPAVPPGGVKKPTVMQRKLSNAQKVLEGLAINDFDLVSKSADELMQCVKEVTWRINETDKYMLYTNEFIRDIEGLQKASKKKNTDAATLAYVQMTLTCVKCHEHLRETRIGLAPELPLLKLKTVPTE